MRLTLNSPLAGDVLITHHHDQPGVIGSVGMILRVMTSISQGCKSAAIFPGAGEAIMVLNVDDAILQRRSTS